MTSAHATPRVLFVGGLGRSGSTLLELLLAASPDVCALGEVVHLWERGLIDDDRCSCGEPFSRCHFWQAVGERAFGGWSQVDVAEVTALKAVVDRTRHIPKLDRARLSHRMRERVERYTDYYVRIYRAALAVSGARVAVDSSKHASLAYALRWARELDLRVLHLVRDSRGVAYSWSKAVRRPEVTHGEEYMPRWSPLTVSALWMAQNLAFDRLARRATVKRLRYEDFTAAPEATLADVRAMVDLAPDEEASTGQRMPVCHSVAGNPLRFSGGPLQVRRDEAWRTALSWRRRATVGLLTLPLRLRYGYRGGGG